jgi:hypothetical protein
MMTGNDSIPTATALRKAKEFEKERQILVFPLRSSRLCTFAVNVFRVQALPRQGLQGAFPTLRYHSAFVYAQR